MKQFAGQAALWCGQGLHLLARFVIALALLASLGLGVLAWRLSQGPLDLPWLATIIAAQVNTKGSPTQLSIGQVALAWEGFHGGVDRPLDLRLRHISVVDGQGRVHARVPRAEVSFSVGWLLLGRLVPRAIGIQGARLGVIRDVDGGVDLDLGGLDGATGKPASPGQSGESWSALLAGFSLPPRTDHSSAPQPGQSARWSQLQRIDISDAAVAVDDRQLGLRWTAPKVDIDLRREAEGGLAGQTRIALSFGQQKAELTLQARLRGDGSSIEAQLTPIRPARIAATSPALISLDMLDAPVSLSGQAELDADLRVRSLRATAAIGAGAVHVAQGEVPFEGAQISAKGSGNTLDVTLQRLTVLGHAGGTPSLVAGSLHATRAASGVQANGRITVDQLAFADLPALWPAGLASKGTRPWVTANITAGTAQRLDMTFGLSLDATLSHAKLTAIGGGFDGDDLTVDWLRPVPPLTHGKAHLTFVDPDTIDIAVSAAQQSGGGLRVTGGDVRLTGLTAGDQFADIEADLAGPVADLVTLLKNPRFKFLDHQSIKLNDPAGQFVGHLGIPHLPLKANLTVDDVQIRASTHLTGLHLADIAAGRDLDDGIADLSVTNDGLTVHGSARVGGIPAQLQAALDFRSGPPSEVLQKVSLSATADQAALKRAGLDTMGLLAGPVAIQAVLTEQRGGAGEIKLNADLADAGLDFAPLDWRKPAGAAARAAADIRLDHDRLTAIDGLAVQGAGIDISGRISLSGGKPDTVTIGRLILGDGTDVHGRVAWPRAGTGWRIDLAGPRLDLGAQMKSVGRGSRHDRAPTLPEGTVDVSLGRLELGQGRALSAVMLRGASDGRSITSATLSGQVGAGDPFRIAIAPEAGRRRLTGSVPDTGALLRALDVTGDIEGGRLTVSGAYDDTSAGPGDRLDGSARIGAFRLRRAPVVAKLLQAMTLYGVLAAIQGPGLAVNGLDAPFTLQGARLTLNNVRAYNPSLGATVKGSVDLADSACDLQGTIVPAYFFNSLPGKIPFIGRLFSPERGGGVFAATYALTGDCGDPKITVNPLSTVTPGILRGIFGLF